MARWGCGRPRIGIQGPATGASAGMCVAARSSRLVPFTSFSKNETLPDGRKPPISFALGEDRPLAFFAGIHAPQWTSVRKVREGEVIVDFCVPDHRAECVGGAVPSQGHAGDPDGAGRNRRLVERADSGDSGASAPAPG